ncbi:hypothetical protein [Sorangium sp. So ce381]|uniref:hypothetical protein n=1 Tax=Sorangium sp. So ce381 TaxID=3133307 RepID=UPI003F5B09B1
MGWEGDKGGEGGRGMPGQGGGGGGGRRGGLAVCGVASKGGCRRPLGRRRRLR